MTMTKKNKRSPSSARILSILALLVAGFAIYFWWPTPPESPGIIDQQITEQNNSVQDVSNQPESTSSDTNTNLPAPPAESSPEQTGISSGENVPTVEKDPCQTLSEEITSFFRELDQKEYIATYEMNDGSLRYITNISRKLFANPPIVVRENDDLFSILKNVTHLYRVLGKEDLFILKEILSRESDNLENIMSKVYRLSELNGHCGSPAQSAQPELFDLPLSSLYEYAGYFLNTMGGQAYLYRRTPFLRILMRYYAVLILDRANTEGVNRYGIDIRYPLDSLISEMESVAGLSKRTEYLKVLHGLQDRYQKLYGTQGER